MWGKKNEREKEFPNYDRSEWLKAGQFLQNEFAILTTSLSVMKKYRNHRSLSLNFSPDIIAFPQIEAMANTGYT